MYPKLEKLMEYNFFNKLLNKIVYLHRSYLGDLRNPFFNGVIKKIHKWKPDIIHLHNLHGGWVNLNSIATLSKEIKIVVSLHDDWLFTGHCGLVMNCNEWQNLCSLCPDLSRYVPIKRQITKGLRENKLKFLTILAENMAILVSPSESLKRRFIASKIWNGKDIIVIPHGIDTSRYNINEDKSKIRKELDLPINKKIIFFAADGGTLNIEKGYKTLAKALKILPENTDCIVVVAGDCVKYREVSRMKNILTIKVGYLPKELLIKYYSAADIYSIRLKPLVSA